MFLNPGLKDPRYPVRIETDLGSHQGEPQTEPTEPRKGIRARPHLIGSSYVRNATVFTWVAKGKGPNRRAKEATTPALISCLAVKCHDGVRQVE
jgi:hypothetical protein